jgi:uncharacterized protein YPO0396
VPEIASGQTDAEYATVLLRICGVEERWASDGPAVWTSSVADVRRQVEYVVSLIKRRTVANVDAHLRVADAPGFAQQFLAGRR